MKSDNWMGAVGLRGNSRRSFLEDFGASGIDDHLIPGIRDILTYKGSRYLEKSSANRKNKLRVNAQVIIIWGHITDVAGKEDKFDDPPGDLLTQ